MNHSSDSPFQESNARGGIRMVPSAGEGPGFAPWVHVRRVAPGIMGAYQPFGHNFTFLDARQWNDLRAGRLDLVDPLILDDLVVRGFVVPQGAEPDLSPYAPRLDIAELWLVTVQSCNMACRYCVVQGNIPEKERQRCENPDGEAPSAARDVMTPETADAAVRHYARLLQDSRPPMPRVTFYGGEPLLNKKALLHAVPLIRGITYPGQSRPSPVQILVITNGLHYDPTLTEFFLRHRVSVSVSLDGLPRHHDAARVDHAGRGTFERAAESLRRYKAAGLNVGICTTIGTHNVEDLPEIATFFADTFNLPMELQIPADIPLDGGNAYYVDMGQAVGKAFQAFEVLRERGLIEALAMRRLKDVAKGGFRVKDCSAPGGQLVVAPDGSVGPCHALVGSRTSFQDSVHNPGLDISTIPCFREWTRRVPVNMPQCRHCPAIAICGGGCAYNALVRKGSIWDLDPQQCAYMMRFLDWMIEDCWKRYEPGRGRQVPRPRA